MLRKTFCVFVLTIFITGCAVASQTAVTEMTVDATDFAYSPESITVPAGQPVTLRLNNSGAVEHDFVIDKISVSDVEASETGPAMHHQMGEMPDYDLHFYAKAGESAVLKFTPLEPGTYEIYCTIEGHREAGMRGTLIVIDQG